MVAFLGAGGVAKTVGTIYLLEAPAILVLRTIILKYARYP